MERTRNETDPNEPKVSAMIQRNSQDTTTIEWVTAWTPCYDTEHPGPDLCDTSIQWYESPFAIETTNHHEHTSIVRGIRHHELVELIGYDENTRYRMRQQPPEIALAQMRTTPPKQLMAAAISGMHNAEIRTTTQANNEAPATPHDDEGINEELRQALTIMLAHEFQQTTTIPLPTTAQWQDATAQDWDLHTLLVDAIWNQRNIQHDQIRDATLYKLWTQRKLEEEDGILHHNGHGGTTDDTYERAFRHPSYDRQYFRRYT